MKRLLRLVVGLMVGIGALALGVRGITQAGENADRCVRLASWVGTSDSTIDAMRGGALPTVSWQTVTEYHIAFNISPDRKQFIADELTGKGRRVYWQQMFPPRNTTLAEGNIRFGHWLWSPNSRYVAYVIQFQEKKVYTTLNILNVQTGQRDTIAFSDSDMQTLDVDGPLDGEWSWDGRIFALQGIVPNTQQGRLFIIHSGSTAYTALDLPPNVLGAKLSWSPDNRTLVLMGDDVRYRPQTPIPFSQDTRGPIMFYSMDNGTLTTSTYLDPTNQTPRVARSQPFWSPNSRYFYVGSLKGKSPVLNIYGLDGSTYFDFDLTEMGVVDWQQTDSRLVLLDAMPDRPDASRLIAFDPATGSRETLVENIVLWIPLLSEDTQARKDVGLANADGLAFVTRQADGTMALDTLNLRDGRRTHILDNITREPSFDPLVSVNDLPFLVLDWYRGEEFHKTFISQAGQFINDFTGLTPNGQVIRLDSTYVMYQTHLFGIDLTDSPLDLLNLKTGEHRLFLTNFPQVKFGHLDPVSQYIYLNFVGDYGYIFIQAFKMDSIPLKLGGDSLNQSFSLAPDGKHAVRWTASSDEVDLTTMIELRSESGTPMLLMNQGGRYFVQGAEWSADNKYFALMYVNKGTAPESFHVDVYTADGELVSATVIPYDPVY